LSKEENRLDLTIQIFVPFDPFLWGFNSYTHGQTHFDGNTLFTSVNKLEGLLIWELRRLTNGERHSCGWTTSPRGFLFQDCNDTKTQINKGKTPDKRTEQENKKD